MGWGKAAAAQNQGTQMAMMVQAQQAAQAQDALNRSQAQATGALQQGVKAYDPYQQFGVESTNRLATLMGLRPGEGSGSLMNQPTIDQLQMDPGYAFREQQGMRALNASAAARGLGISGANISGAQEFGQELASQEYGNAYQRFMQNRANQMALLQGGVGTGVNAAQGIGGLQGNVANVYRGTGQDLAQNYQNLGQNLGQGYANIGSAYANAAMGPTNLMAALAGQGIQAAGSMAGMNYARTGKFFG